MSEVADDSVRYDAITAIGRESHDHKVRGCAASILSIIYIEPAAYHLKTLYLIFIIMFLLQINLNAINEK